MRKSSIKMKNNDYAVMRVSETHNERRVGGYEAKNDKVADKKFKKWWPEGDGYLQYKLYRLVGMAAGKGK